MNARLNATQKRSIALGCGFMIVLAALALGLTAIFSSLLSSDGSSPASPVTTAPDSHRSTAETFVAVVDGDTIKTSAGTVRIIGIDTPEWGECGYHDASDAIGGLLAAGDPVFLQRPPGLADRDRYDRLLRYVITDTGIDVGLMQLESGHALAKYDSSDGYPEHPKEAKYHAAQTATAARDGSVVTTACASAAGHTMSG